MKFTIKIVCVLWIFSFISLISMAQSTADGASEQTPYTLLLRPRINSAGNYPYSGAYVNQNPNTDLNIEFDRKGLGFFIFSSRDLKEKKSILNYTQVGMMKEFKPSDRLKLISYLGYYLDQFDSFRGADSDYWTSLEVAYHPNANLKIECTALISNIGKSALYKSLSNRVHVDLKVGKFNLGGYVWYRTVMRKFEHAISTSVALQLPKIHLTKRLYIRNSVAIQTYVTKERPDFAMRRGILFAMVAPLDLSSSINLQ